MNNVATISLSDEQVTLTFVDGTTKVFSAAPNDEDVEVDIITASGVKKTFVEKV